MQLTSEQFACLQLSLCEGIGPVRMQKGLDKYGNYASALSAVKAARAKSIKAANESDVKRVLADCEKQSIYLLFIDSPDFPAALKNIPDAPHVLYLKGNINLLGSDCASIVGTRNASLNGLKFTEKMAKTFGNQGICTVSGLARGIDAAAHKGALATNGRTIAVLAGGLGKIYPPEHTNLAEQIIENDGLLISEMPPHTEHIAPLFPRRNRIVAGLSKVLCVMECAVKSGSLITAKLALEQGREVFAVPGHPADPRAAGPNSLLKQGAHWLEKPGDVLELYKEETKPELDLFSSQEQKAEIPVSDSPEQKVLDLLTTTPTSLDDLCAEAGTDITTLTTTLTMLDMDGHIAWHGGNKVSKVTS